LQTKSFDWKKDVPFNPQEPGSVGFIAEEVNQIFPELVGFKNGEPEGVKYELLSVYLFDIVKDFVSNFAQKLQASLVEFGVQLENGIMYLKEVIADKFTAKQFCLTGDDGETICVDKNQLKELMNKPQIPISNDQPNSNDQNSNPPASPTPDLTPTPTTMPTPDSTGASSEPQPNSSPQATPSPQASASPEPTLTPSESPTPLTTPEPTAEAETPTPTPDD